MATGLGLLAELVDRRVRSRQDIADLLEVPVFAVIQGKSEKMSANLLIRQTQKLLAIN